MKFDVFEKGLKAIYQSCGRYADPASYEIWYQCLKNIPDQIFNYVVVLICRERDLKGENIIELIRHESYQLQKQLTDKGEQKQIIERTRHISNNPEVQKLVNEFCLKREINDPELKNRNQAQEWDRKLKLNKNDPNYQNRIKSRKEELQRQFEMAR